MYNVKSFTNQDTEYTVRHMNDGTWRCSCPLFIFNEKKMGLCKHIAKVMHDEKLVHVGDKGVVSSNLNAEVRRNDNKQSINSKRT